MEVLKTLQGLRKGAEISRNRDLAWEGLLQKKSAERLLAVDLRLKATAQGFALDITDERAKDAEKARHAQIGFAEPWFLLASVANALRREAVAALEAARAVAVQPLPPAAPVQPPAPHPEDTLSYLAHVYNSQAAAFYAKHGVKLVGAAYESHEELGEAPLVFYRTRPDLPLPLHPRAAERA